MTAHITQAHIYLFCPQGSSYTCGSEYGYGSPDAIQIKRSVSQARSVTVMRYGCYANGFPFDSHLSNFCFFSLLFFRRTLGVTFRG